MPAICDVVCLFQRRKLDFFINNSTNQTNLFILQIQTRKLNQIFYIKSDEQTKTVTSNLSLAIKDDIVRIELYIE